MQRYMQSLFKDPQMKISRLPFGERFRYPILHGKKICTSRTKKYGNVGDIFEAFGKEFTLIEVEKKSLNEVAYVLYKEEGCI